MPRYRPSKRALIAVLGAAALVGALLVARNLIVPGPLDRLAAEPAGDGRTAHTGSWRFPRGGPYVLGFDSPGGAAVLLVDGREVARGSGRVSQRILFSEGVFAVRLEAPPGARLLWHPPGRRGPLEYVPPSSLSPESPERAAFSSGAGARRADGAFALAILAVLLALVLYLAREPLRRADRPTVIAAASVFALAFGVRLIGLGAAGQTWDEDVNWSAGLNYAVNLLSLDFDQGSWTFNLEHPPVSKYVAGLGALFSDGYGPARALSALVMALGCAVLVPIGRRLYALPVGAAAGAIAALTPHLVAHGKVVGHEAPAMLLWGLCVWAALCAHEGGRERLPWRLVLCGVILGLAISSRFANGLLAPLVGALLLVCAPAGERRRTVLLGLGIVAIAAVAVSVLVWPRLWSTPLSHLAESWAILRRPHDIEPFLGTFTNTPPRHYFAVYLAATAPLGILLGAAAWAFRALVRRERADLVLFLWLAVPLLVALSPVRQDGVRYIMPSLAALALAAAVGLRAAAAVASRLLRTARARAVFPALAGAFGLYLAVTCVRIHPYYLDYYGEQVGGPARVAERQLFEIAWWGEGIEEAIAFINREAQPGASVSRRCVAPSHLTWFRGDLWEREVAQPERADWILVYQPSWRPCPLPADAELVYEVSAQGAPLARVYRRAAAEP